MILMNLIIITTIPAFTTPNNISSTEKAILSLVLPSNSSNLTISEIQSKPIVSDLEKPQDHIKAILTFDDDIHESTSTKSLDESLPVTSPNGSSSDSDHIKFQHSIELIWSTNSYSKNSTPPNPIIFEEISSSPTKTEDLNATRICSETQTFYNGTCYTVLQQLPCPAGQWLVEDEKSKTGKCVENKCAGVPDTAFYNKTCVKVRSEEPCSSGMRTYIYKSGQVECDCKEGFLYDAKSGNCYEAYRQGPCQKARYFAISPNKGQSRSIPKCTPNPCIFDGYFCNIVNTSYCSIKRPRGSTAVTIGQLPRNCVKLGSPCTKNGRGLYVIHPNYNTPACIDDIMDISRPDRVIGNVPTLKCAPGSRRDILGNCRAPTVIDFS